MTSRVTGTFAAHCCFIWGHSKHNWGENKVITVILDLDGDCALSNTESFTVTRSLAVPNDDLRFLKIANQRIRTAVRVAIQDHFLDAVERRIVPGARESAGLQLLAAYRAPRRVDSTMALCVQKKWPPATTATIIMRKNAEQKANSIVATPSSEL